MSYAAVPWDAELFGLPFYELRCEGSVEEIESAVQAWRDEIGYPSRPALAYTRIQPSDVHLAEALGRVGFYPAETTLHIAMPLRRFTRIHPTSAGRARLRPARPEDLSTVSTIAAETFTTDRFHLDPHLPKKLSDRRYVQWVERGFRDGDPLFVYETTNEPAEVMGFYLIRGTPGGEVDLSLAGVSASHRRGGVGALMYEDVLEHCRDLGFRSAVTSISTNNPDVVNLFFRLGFTIRSARLTMHHYLNAGSGAA